jgi:hypothetical protein
MSLIIPVIRRAVAFLLIAESLLTAARMTSMLSIISVYDGVALLLIVLRALLVPLQFAGGWFVASRRPQGPPLARAALVLGAVLTVFDVGLGLAPSPIYPWWRWQATLAYAIYAVLGVLVMRSGEAGS